MIAQQGVIPNIMPEYNGFTLEDFAKGAADQAFKDVASEAVQFGQQHGGFFYSPMREMNINWWPWGQQPRQAKRAWQHVWQIFEDTGANEYSTWVWEIKCPNKDRSADDPEPYYPGDKYVDWIGLSAYSRTRNEITRNMSFNELTGPTYHEMHNNHVDKPIMQAEFGTTQGSSQPYWVKNAYKTIKSLPGMKAALYWDYSNAQLGDQHSLSQESLAALKEILKDPYWITAK